MASERRTCPKPKGCGRKFSRPLGSRRLYCETCSPPRKPARGVVEGAPPPVLHGGEPGPIEAAALAQLQAVERHETVAGVLVLALARDIDAGTVTPAQKGGAGQKLIALLAEAMRGTTPPRQPDALDEITRRRMERAAAAS